ncbi:putative cytochrome P450 monooxygenase [Aspergillus uvarum CBS 121591]|uniref:Putative cytochrome P450 monooxygenase n=1 Tax=Aspergillus uvarum CBS 121591 TaxID=1448315 RepID=A0A319C357_9EURO|nr:putative cytochrome P450 monooxygenase [Aspergillus uvarum CBS 121591]PYH78661.1 putative cytochrome P450 monooxygenase [Aspergillus uvarum CBS 121591]
MMSIWWMTVGLFSIYKALFFVRLYIQARRTGFPIVFAPAPTASAPWLVLAPILRPYLQPVLPEWLYNRLDIGTHGWEFRMKRGPFDRWGNTFVLLTLDECMVWTGDVHLGNVILQRRNDFEQAPIVGKILGFLGPNVFATNGDEWKRHRRMFAASLDERISRIAWSESREQARSMLNYLFDHPGGDSLTGLRSLAINVIGQAGYTKTTPWSPTPLRDRPGQEEHARTAYFKALALATDLFFVAAFIPPKILKLSFMPAQLRLLGQRLEKVPQYIAEISQEERQTARDESVGRSNFLRFLLQNSDTDTTSGFGFTPDELSGNLYVFTVAGYETTANTMGFAVTLLAAYPEWQEWIREELRELPADSSPWSYNDVFPNCQRTLAIMLEVLRLFPPVLHSTRAVSGPQQLVSEKGTHLLAPPMNVMVSAMAIHLDTTIWGEDATVFRPSRWIDDTGKVKTPPKGTFLPWSGGPRVCPGLKMSQVEFVSTIATLFRSARCEPMPVDGISQPEDLRRRLVRLTDNAIAKSTLQVKDHKTVQLRWVRDVQ